MKTLKLKKVITIVTMFLLAIALIIVGETKRVELSEITKQKYLDNNNQTKITWGDLTGNGYDATAYNTGWNDASTGMVFNGTSSYAQIKEVNLEQFTLEVAFRASNLSKEGEQTLLANFQEGGYGLLIRDKRLIGQAYLDGEWKTISTEDGEGTVSDVLEENIMYVAHLTFDGTNLSLYLDGELIGTVTGTTLTYPKNNTIMMLGENPDGTNAVEDKYLEGTIHEAKIYSKSLSDNEIENNLEIVERVYADGVSGRLNNIEGYVQDGLLMDLEGRKIERTQERIADLSLRTFITKINGEELSTSREPNVEIVDGKFNYKHSKNKVNVVKGDVITYKIRVYNEGKEAANAEKVGIYLPEEMKVIGLDDSESVNSKYLWTQDEGNVFITKYLSNQEIKKNGVKVIENRSIPAYSENAGIQYKDIELEILVNEDITIADGYRLVVVAEIMKESQNDSDSTPRNFNMTQADIKTYKKAEAEQSSAESYIAGKEDDDDFENVYVNKTYDAKIELNKISIANEKNIGGGKIKITNNVSDSDIRLKIYNKATMSELEKDENGYVVPPQEGVLIGLSRLQKNVENEILIEEESAAEGYVKVIDSTKLKVKINANEEIEAIITSVVEKKIKEDGTVETQELSGSIEKDAFLRDEDQNGLVTKDGIATGQRVEYKIGEDGEWKRYTGSFKLQTNKTIYARSTDGTNYSGTAIKVVDNIDKIAPTIDTIADKEETLDIETSIEFHVTDTSTEDYGASGVSKFGISENDVDEPEEWLDADKTTDFTGTVEHIEDEGTFRIWVKDVAGNIAISNEFRIDLPDISVAKITAIVDRDGNEITSLINTEYYTLESCFATIPEGATATVQVIHRIYNEANVLDGNKTVTLDLNGYTIGNRSRREPTFTIGSENSDASLTVINNKGRGGVSSNNTEAIVINDGSIFTLGEDNKRVVQSQPKITGKTTGIDVKNGGVFNFYDGNITAEKAIYGNVSSTPIGYNAFIEDSTTDELQTATLQVISNVEARIGRKMYTLLEDAIADCQTKYGTDGSQVEVVLLKNIAKDMTIEIAENQNIKLDLNGHDFTTVTNGYVVDNKGKFELFDSSVMTGSYDYKVEAEDTSRVSRNGGSNISTNGFTGVQKYKELAFNFDIEEYGTYMFSISGIYMSRESDIYLDDSDTSMYNFAERTYGAEYTTVNVILDNLDPGTHRLRVVNNAEGGEQPIIDYFEVSNNKGSGRIYSTTNHVIHNWNFDERVTDISKIDTVDYEELITDEKVSIHNAYRHSRTWTDDLSVYRDEDNSIALNETTCEDWSAGYIEIDLTDKEVKPYLIQFDYHAKSTGNRRLDMYFSAYEFGAYDREGRILYRDGGNFDLNETYKAYVTGGSKHYIHLAMYKNRYCNNEFDFRVKSIKLVEVNDFNMAQMTITSGIIDTQKTGTYEERTGGIFNEGNLIVKGGRFTTALQTGDDGRKCGIRNYGFVTIQDAQFDGMIHGIYNGWYNNSKYGVMTPIVKINNVNMNCTHINYMGAGHSIAEIKKGKFNSKSSYEVWQNYEDSTVIINPESDEDVQFMNGGDWEIYMSRDNGKQLYIKGGTFRHAGGIIYSYDDYWRGSQRWMYNQITIDGGDFQSTSGEMIATSYSAKIIVNGGKFVTSGDRIFRINNFMDVTINDGEFYATRGTGNILYCDYYDNSYSKLTINGGYFTNVTEANNSYWTLFQFYYGAHVTINGGELHAGSTVFHENRGNLDLKILGGNITSNVGPLTNTDNHDGGCSVVIGTKDGNVEMQPEIKVSTSYPLVTNNNATVKFYDGVLYAQKNPFLNCNLEEIEDNTNVVSEDYGERGLKVWLGDNSSQENVEIYECPDNQSLVGTKYSTIQKALDQCSTDAGDNVTKIRLLKDYSNFEINTIKKGQNVIIDQDAYILWNYRNNGFDNYGKVEFINTQNNLYSREIKNTELVSNHIYPERDYNFTDYRIIKDKSGRNNDLELLCAGKDADTNGIACNTYTTGVIRNWNITDAEQKAMEIVLKTTTRENTCIFMSPNGQHMAFGVWNNTFLLSCKSNNNQTFVIPDDFYDGTMKDIVINYNSETNQYTVYYNGRKLETRGSGNWWGNGNSYGAFFGRRPNQDNFHGTVFALRQYSENLTEEQIATNYESAQEKYVDGEDEDNYTTDNLILDIDSSTIDWEKVALASHNVNNYTTNSWGYQKIDLRDQAGRFLITVNAETRISNISGRTSWAHARILTDTSIRGESDTTGRFIHVTGDTTATDYTYEVEGGKIYYLHYGFYHNSQALETFTINSIKVTTIQQGKIFSRNCNLLKNGRLVEEESWKDLSGNNRHGVLVGPVWDDDNRGLVFDGNDYVRIAQMNYRQFTFESTFELSSIHNGWNTVMSNYHSGGWGLSVNGSDKKLYARAYINGDYRNIPLEIPIEVNTKYTAGIMYDGHMMYLYVNGMVVNTWKSTDYDTYKHWPDSSTYVVLGGDAAGSGADGEWLNGKVYSARGYSRKLTDLEIAQNYQKDRALYYGDDAEYIENITGYVEKDRILDFEGRHHADSLDNSMYAKLGANLYIEERGLKNRDVIKNAGTLDIDTYKFIVDGRNTKTIRNDNDGIVNIYGWDYDSTSYENTVVFDNHRRGTINYYDGNTEATTSESSIIFNNLNNSTANIYDGIIRKNGRYVMNQNGGYSTMNIYGGTITCEGRWDGETRILYNYENGTLNISGGIINYYATSNYSTRYGIDNINSAEFHITGGKINWQSTYCNYSRVIRNASPKHSSIENYEIYARELNTSTDLIHFLNEGTNSEITIKNSKFWQDAHTTSWNNHAAIYNNASNAVVNVENFISDTIWIGINNPNGTVNVKNCNILNSVTGINISAGAVNCDGVNVESTTTGLNQTGGTLHVYGNSRITSTTNGANVTGGTFILGQEGANSEDENEPIVDINKPYIQGVNYGVNNTATFKFYDGRIKANDGKSITGNITAKEAGYQVKVIKYTEGESGNEIAKEDSILAQLPIIEIVGVGEYTNLRDFQTAVDGLETTEEVDGETITREYKINLLQNISMDASEEGLTFKEGLKATFDIKGYRFTSANKDVITNNGDMTFIDSVGTGEYYNNSNGSYFINNGKMKVSNAIVRVLGAGNSGNWKKIFNNIGDLEFDTINFTSSGGSYTHMIYDEGEGTFKDTNSKIIGTSSLGETDRERIYNNATGDMEFNGTTMSYISYIQNVKTGNMTFNDIYQDNGWEIVNHNVGNITYNGTSKSYTTYGIRAEGGAGTSTITINDETLISGYYRAFTNDTTAQFIMNGGSIETRYSYSPETIRQTGNGLIQINGGTVVNHVKRIYAGKFVVDGETAVVNGEYIYLNNTGGMYGTFELRNGNVNCRIQSQVDNATINILGGNLNCDAASWSIDAGSYKTNITIGTKDGEVTNSPHIRGYIWSYYYSNTCYYDGTITVSNSADYLSTEVGFYGLVNEFEEGYTPEKNVNSEHEDWYDITLVEQKEIAEVDGVKYDDLQEAIDACTTSGKTIKMLKDYIEVKTYTVPSGIDEESEEEQELKKITLDLNGHIIAPIGRDWGGDELSREFLHNYGDLTITDSVEAEEDENGDRLVKNKRGKIHGYAQGYIDNYGNLKFDSSKMMFKAQAWTNTIRNYNDGNVSFDNFYMYDRALPDGSPQHRVVYNYSTGKIELNDSIIDFYGEYVWRRGESQQYFVYNTSNNSEQHTEYNINNSVINALGSSSYYFVLDDANGQMDTEIHDSKLVSFNNIKKELKIYDSSINGYMYANNYEAEILLKNVRQNRYINCQNAWFTIEDCNLGTDNDWNYTYFYGKVRSIKNSNFSTNTSEGAHIYGTDGAGVIENSRFYRFKTYNGSNLELKDVTIQDYIENGASNHQNCRITINGGTYDKIYSNTLNDVITLNSGNFRYIENRANSKLYIYGGNYNNTSGECVNNAGIFTLGADDGEVSIEEPAITGSTYGVTNTGTFNFYDGIIQGGNKAINGSVTAKPVSYRVSYLQNNTVAILDYVTQVENAVTMNGVYYNTLDAAIKVAPSNQEIYLYINNEIGLTDTFVIPEDKNIVINLQGNSITYSSTEPAIINNGILRIYDYFENEEGIHETTYGAVRNDRGLAIDNRGTLTLGENDGTVDTTTPSVVGLGEALRNSGTFAFYDGRCVVLDNNGNETVTVADESVQTADVKELSTLRKLGDNTQISIDDEGRVISRLSSPEIAVTPSYWTNQDVEVTMNATDRVIMNIGDRQQGMDLSLKQYVSKVGNTAIDRKPVITEETEQAILRTQNGVYGRSEDEVYANVEDGDDEVTYTISIYNEGTETGYAAEIIEFIPENLEFVSDNEVNIANGWEVASTDSTTGRVTAVKTNNLANVAALADLDGDSIMKLLRGEIETVPSVDLVLKVHVTPTREKVYHTVNGEITAAKDSSGNTYGAYFTEGNGVNSDLDSTPANYPAKSEDDNDGDTFYTLMKKGKVNIKYVDQKTNQEISDSTVIEGFEGDPYNALSYGKIIENYRLMREPEEPTGTFTKDTQEKVFYYAHISAGVVVNHIDVNTDRVIKTETLTGIEDQDYTTSSEEFEGYDLVESRLPDANIANGKMTIDAITVNYYYERQTTVRVKHLDKYLTGDNAKLCDDIVIEGHEKDEYTTEAKTFDGYKLDETSLPQNASGTMEVVDRGNGNVQTETTVIYYYISESEGVDILYKDTYSDKEIAEKTSITGYEGDQYTSEAKTFMLYDLDESRLPTNASGTLGKDKKTVTYYYKHAASIRVEYVDKNANTKIVDDDIIEGHENDVKEVRPKDIDDYVLDSESQKDDYNVTMVVTRDADKNVISFTTVVTFYYNKVSAGVIEKHIDIYDDTLMEEPTVHEGSEGQYYKINPKTFAGFDLVETSLPDNAEGHMSVSAIEVKYYYARKTQLIIKHIDVQTNTEIPNSRITINNHRKDNYTTSGKAIAGYKLQEDRLPDNASGVMEITENEGNIDITTTVTYYYESTSSAGVTVHFRDIKTNKDIKVNGETTTYVIRGERYQTYETTPKEIEGYTLVSTVEEEIEVDGETITHQVSKLPANANGQLLEEAQDVIYYYIKQATVKVEYYDTATDEKIDEDTTLNGVEGENYTTSPKAITGFVVDEDKTPTNANGVYKVERDENFEPTNTEVIVKYYYKAISKGVVVHHIDDKHDTILETETLEGIEGDNYETASKTFEGFDLVETKLPTNKNGKFAKESITVNYYYVRKTKVIASYIDIEGGKLAEDVIIENHEGDEYETEAKTFTNYKLVETPENHKGTTKVKVNEDDSIDVVTHVTYEYESTVSAGLVVHHKDLKTKTELKTDTYNGERHSIVKISSKDIPLYDLARSELVDGKEVSLLPESEDIELLKDLQEVTYYYRRKAKVIVEYRDTLTNETVMETETIEGHEDENYEVSAKDIKGYVLDQKRLPSNTKGTMKVNGTEDTTIVTFYYKLIPADVIERYVDINTQKVIEEVVHKGEFGEEYTITPKTIPGFTLMTKDKDGNDIVQTAKGKYTTTKIEIVYYVALNTTVRVQYINLITDEKMSDDLVIRGYEGKEYTTSPDEFEGYELTNDPEEAHGRMKAEEIVVKYYYAKKLDGLLPQTNETNTKQMVLIAIPIIVLVNLALGVKAFKRTKKEEAKVENVKQTESK